VPPFFLFFFILIYIFIFTYILYLLRCFFAKQKKLKKKKPKKMSKKHPILGSKHLNFLDFKSAAYIIKNKEHLNKDGLGLEKILQLKRRITSLYSNKAMNNHSVVDGIEKLDQKR
jgi:hypothetical protein